jgi:hypothetical protein
MPYDDAPVSAVGAKGVLAHLLRSFLVRLRRWPPLLPHTARTYSVRQVPPAAAAAASAVILARRVRLVDLLFICKIVTF